MRALALIPAAIAAAVAVTLCAPPAAAQSVAHIVAAPLVGRVLDRTHNDYRGVLVVLGAIALPGAVAWALWRTPPVAAPARDAAA